jgi:hypothetical protein
MANSYIAAEIHASDRLHHAAPRLVKQPRQWAVTDTPGDSPERSSSETIFIRDHFSEDETSAENPAVGGFDSRNPDDDG